MKKFLCGRIFSLLLDGYLERNFCVIWKIYVQAFKKLTKYFLSWLHNFMLLPAVWEGFSFSTSSPAFAFVCLFRYSCSSGWKIVFHCGFDCCCCLATKWCPSLCDSMFYSPPGSSVHGFSRARILRWVARSFCRKPSQPRNGNSVTCTAGGFFNRWSTREVFY